MRHSAKRLWFLLAVATGAHLAFAQAARAPAASAAPLDLDALLHTPGPSWSVSHSHHFRIYVERSDDSAERNAGVADSLEAAWINAEQLLGERIPAEPAVPVLITASRTRFPGVMKPDNKGLTTWTHTGAAIIVLIHNDSVKAYTRHEVMHLAARRTWGPPRANAVWLIEGLATFADGRCQATTVTAVARDILRQSPAVTMQDATAGFSETAKTDRARAYVLAGSVIGYLWDSRGRDGLQAIWRGRDSLAASVLTASAPGSPFTSDPTTSWRAYVARVAGAQPGLDAASFRRAGCG